MRRSMFIFLSLALAILSNAHAGSITLDSEHLTLEVDETTGQWALLDKQSTARWPSEGMASPGKADWLGGEFLRAETPVDNCICLVSKDRDPAGIVFTIVDEGRAVELRYQGKADRTIRVLDDALAITNVENGYIVVPCREGLLIPANSGKSFKHTFGTSDYEGCHMNMLGFIKSGGTLVVTWDDAYVFPEISSSITTSKDQKLTASFDLRRSANTVRLMPLGKGDWNTIALGYRQYAQRQGIAVTLKQKIERDPHVERMLGASNAKLWTCLSRRMNDDSTAEESVNVCWTFDEAAKIAEHLHNDLDIMRCFFMMGGWTEGGYDCRHPDNLPANPECGGNEALADAVKRIQALGFVGCLHDNVQDMYKDAKSWSPDFIEKQADGKLVTGGRWLGGRAYMVCAPKQLELAQRAQNLPAIAKLFAPWSYFIDTTYAVGPRECYDPNHPIDRNLDIAWKIKLSDYSRDIFGIFGSECGREWALPHSDFFEGLVGVSGKYYHNLKPEEYGATVIPFFEMVYHDCQVCYGKYGYSSNEAAEFVAHHVLCARPLYYHSFPHHLYWQSHKPDSTGPKPDIASFTRSDIGWADGMHPLDIFIKNTHEVLGPLNHATAHDRLTRLEFVTSDQKVRKTTYGQGQDAMQVIVNFGTDDATITTSLGGETVLPAWGFAVEGPRFAAFYARKWNGLEYDSGALFTLQSVDDEDLSHARRVRIFHAFGSPKIQWKGKLHEVKRENIIEVR